MKKKIVEIAFLFILYYNSVMYVFDTYFFVRHERKIQKKVLKKL